MNPSPVRTTVLEELGFRLEAVLRDEAKDCVGKTHGLLPSSNDVATFLACCDNFGLTQ
jgi:hypothetical protein